MQLLSFPTGSDTMGTTNTAGTVKGSKAKATTGNKLKEAQEAAKTFAVIALFLMSVLLMILPKLVKTLKALRNAKDELGKKGIRTRGNTWVSGIETEGLRVDGEEMVQCAHEGLRARVRKAKEEQDAELSRRVAIEVKKAMQGQAKA